MDYTTHYNRLITRGKTRILTGYQEKHHIVPKCLGGNNSKNNLVYLTASEHYVAHQLLVKMYPDNKKLIYAAKMMCSNKVGRSNKLYSWLRERFAKEISIVNTGKIRSEETKQKLREANAKQINRGGGRKKGYVVTEATKEKIRKKRALQVYSEETKLKMSISTQNRSK